MSEQEKLRLYEQLASWAESVAIHLMRKYHLQRHWDDIIQEARVALWIALGKYDPTRCHGDTMRSIRILTQNELLNALKRYRRWDEREMHFPDSVEL